MHTDSPPPEQRSSGRRIGFDARSINDRYHGIGRHAFGLLEALSRLSPDDQFVAYVYPGYSNTRFDVAALARRPNVRLKVFPLALYAPLELLVWPAVLARDGIGMFHSAYVNVPVLSPVRLLPTVHDLIFERFPQYMPQRGFRLLYTAQMRLAMWRAAAVLTVSQATCQDVVAYYPVAKHKMHVVGNAVGSEFAPVTDAPSLEAVRAGYDLPAHFVLALGAGRPHKNLEVLVEAFARLAEGSSAASRLVLAGELDTRFADRVGQMIEAYRLQDRIQRIGHVREQDLPALYSLADVFVFPSLVEGFGLPVLEAMACETPVLASNASSVPEVAGDGARLFDPRDPNDLAAQLAELLSSSSLRASLAQRGAAHARSFTWDRVARAALAVYDGVWPDTCRTVSSSRKMIARNNAS